MSNMQVIPTPESVQEFRKEVLDLMQKYIGDVSAEQLVAVAANIVGSLSVFALSEISEEQIKAVISANIDRGHDQTAMELEAAHAVVLFRPSGD